MGITGFFKLFNDNDLEYVSYDDISESTVVVDTSNWVYKIKMVAVTMHKYDDSYNFINLFVYLLIKQLTCFMSNKIHTIFVFDGKPNDLKLDTLQKRKEKKDINQNIDSEIVIVKKIFDLFGIEYINGVDGIDAENICAKIQMKRYATYVMSDDADCFAFGCTMLLKKNKSGSDKAFILYKSDNLIDSYGNKLSHSGIVKVAICLGTDFAVKVPKIGIKTVLAKYKDIVFDERQQKTKQLFIENIKIVPMLREAYNRSFVNNDIDIDKGINYLSEFSLKPATISNFKKTYIDYKIHVIKLYKKVNEIK